MRSTARPRLDRIVRVPLLASLVLLPQTASAQEERNKELVRRFYDEALHRDDYAFADELFATDYARHQGTEPVQTGDAPLQSTIAREFKEIVPDVRFELGPIVAEGDLVAVHWISRGSPVGPPALMRRLVGMSGPVVVNGVNFYRFRDGRVIEIWNTRDDLPVMRQAGMFRWLGIAGFLAGVATTLLVSWALRRRRAARSRTNEEAFA